MYVLVLRLSPPTMRVSDTREFCPCVVTCDFDREEYRKQKHGHDHGLLAIPPLISGLSIRDFEHLRVGGGTSRADAVVSRATGGSERFGLHAKGSGTGGG